MVLGAGTLLAACDYGAFFNSGLRRKNYPDTYDADHDGIPDQQELANKLNPDDPNDANADPDGDGLSNYWEIKLGFDPHNRDSGSKYYGMNRAGNGVDDCHEDLVGDGIALCWKIKYDFDPVGVDHTLVDSDGDGFSDLEEYTAGTDPNDAKSLPGKAPVLVVSGYAPGFTNNVKVKGTLSYCGPGDMVLFTSVNVRPAGSDPGFVACSTAPLALSGTLPSANEGVQTMYVWRRIKTGATFGVVDHPVSGTVVVDNTASAGTLALVQAGATSLTIALMPPTAVDYAAFKLIRLAQADCSAATVDSGTLLSSVVGTTLVTDSGLSLNTPYCYKAFWTDRAGNIASSSTTFNGTGPASGTLSISGFSSLGIKLALTPPDDGNYTHVDLRRYAGTSCTGMLLDAGVRVSLDSTGKSANDTGLSLATPYCYQAFWYDTFGNASASTVTNPYAGSGPTAGTLAIKTFASQAITLAITPPSDTNYSKVDVRRYALATCSGKSLDAGTAVTVDTSSNTATDSGLALATPYCYQAFWYDVFGNVTTSVVTKAYTGAGPTGGSISIGSYGSRTINLALTPPSDANYARLDIRRYAAATCSGSSLASGTNVPADKAATAVADSGLALSTPYCYQAFWYDTFGNVASGVVANPYSGAGPSGGALTVASRTASAITLTLTAPTSANYASINLRRIDASSCTNSLVSDGTGVTVSPATATAVTDTGLQTAAGVGHNYCYKAFWYDTFGNVTSAVPAAGGIAATTLPPDCCLNTTQTTWYQTANMSYNFDYGSTSITAVTDFGTPSVRPAMLSTVSALPATSFTITGTASSTLALTTWAATINAQANVQAQTRVINTTPTYTIPSTLSLTSNVAANGTATAVLDAQYDGGGGSLKSLIGDAVTPATTSNGSVALTQSDIYGLTYTDGSCAAGTSPYVCPLTSTYTSGSKTLSGGVSVLWNYGYFDQGSYDLKTLNYLNVDGAKFYSSAAKTVITVPDPGNEPTIYSATSIGDTPLFGATTWQDYQPALALNEKNSTASKQVYGLLFAAGATGQYNQYAAQVTVDRGVNANTATSVIDDTVNTYKISYNVPSPNTGANTKSMALASTANSAAEWLAVGGVNNGGGTNLVLTEISAGSVGLNRMQVTSVPDNSKFTGVAIAPAFTDSDGNSRHGMAFHANWLGAGTQKIYVSKIRSVPTVKSATDYANGYFDAGSYYDGTSDVNAQIKAVPISADLAAAASMLRIVNAVEGGANYFYVAWRNHGTGAVSLARVAADGVGSVPAVKALQGGDEIINMSTGSGKWGRAAYGMAAGQDNAGTPNAVIGVLYADDQATSACKFRAYKYSSGAGMVVKAITSDLQVSTSTDCRFPHLFWNASSLKFMAIWVEGNGGATKYAEFALDSGTPALVPASPTEVVVTASRATRAKTQVCNLAAQYSPTEGASTRRRIGIVSLESADCNAGGTADMRFDMYKPAR